jgi:hypothetical protein
MSVRFQKRGLREVGNAEEKIQVIASEASVFQAMSLFSSH